MSSVKCPQCGLVNFANADACKRCGAKLSEINPETEAPPMAGEASAPPSAQFTGKPNLYPCPDCDHMVSSRAVACPQCGRYFQRFTFTVDRSGWAGTIAGGIFLIFILFVLLNILLFVLLTGSRR